MSDVLSGASTSVLPTSSINVLPVNTSDNNNNNNNLKTSTSSTSTTTTTTISTTQLPKSAIVHAGSQIIITTTAQKVTSQQLPTQKVVSVVPATISAASSSSTATNSNTNNSNNSSTGSTSDVNYQHYQSFNDSAIYPNTLANTFYNPSNNQTPSNFPSTTTLASSESQAPAVYYMYPEGSLELENGYDIEGHVSHTAQAAPVTVQWLVDNFEPAEGCSLRRSSLYNFYMHHCDEQKIEPVNPASFGKLIRSVFLGLRTRRLGTRGNSKYHYYGIRVKANSPLNSIPEDHAIPSRSHTSPTSSINPPTKRVKTTMYSDHEYKPTPTAVSQDQNHWTTHQPQQQQPQQQQQQQTTIINNGNSVLAEAITTSNTNSNVILAAAVVGTNAATTTTTTPVVATVITSTTPVINSNSIITPVISESELKTQEFLKVINSLPNMGAIILDNVILPENCDVEDVRKFEDLYKNHCQKILDLVIGLKLSSIDEVWQKFWRCENVDCSDYEKILPKDKFIALCTVQAVIDFVKGCDYQFYQFCVDALIPDVLRAIPSHFTQQIRNFAKSLENWLRNALINIPEDMQQMKLKIINAFAMTLRRYTTLNHLSQAAKALLQNTQQINQMLNDLHRVDFRSVQQQASWICQCDDESIMDFEREFKKNLQSKISVEEWARWLDSVITFCLQKYEGTPKYSKMAHQFLFKWSFYCSTIIRDLTLRSAPSFGGFHLIRLLYDEYMFYLVEHKIAKSVNETAIAVMADSSLVHGGLPTVYKTETTYSADEMADEMTAEDEEVLENNNHDD